MKMNMAAPPKKDFMHLTFIPLLLCLFFFTTILKAQEDRRGIKIDAAEFANRQSLVPKGPAKVPAMRLLYNVDCIT